METLLQQSKISPSRLESVLVRILSSDMDNLSQACYIPGHKANYHKLLNITGLTDKDIKNFAKRTYDKTQVKGAPLANETGTNLLLFIMWYALNKRKKDLYHGTLVYHMVRQHGHVMKRQFPKFCNEEVFAYALETITRTHLFAREKTIGGTLMFLAKELKRKYTNDIQTFNVDGIIKFIYSSRQRISQSVKSFAEHYYRAYKEGISIKTHQDALDDEGNQYQAQQLERGKKVIDASVKKLTVYKTIDVVAMEQAKKITKIKFEIANILTRQLNDTRYADEIRLILKLFIDDITDKSMICGKGYEVYVKKLMAVKRTRARIYFKQRINILLLKLLKDTGFMKTFLSYTPQTQFIINSYLAYYLTMVMRNLIC